MTYKNGNNYLKLIIEIRVSSNYFDFLVLDWNTRNHTTVCKLFVLDRNT